MSLFTNQYSSLLTNGLGISASCMLTVLPFRLLGCSLSVGPPPPTPPGYTGGGGTAITPGYLTRAPDSYLHTSKYVYITIKMRDKTWKKSYAVGPRSAKTYVQLIQIINRISDKSRINVARIRKSIKQFFIKVTNKDTHGPD